MTNNDLVDLLDTEEQIAEKFKDFLSSHSTELAKLTGLSSKELHSYIDRIIVA